MKIHQSDDKQEEGLKFRKKELTLGDHPPSGTKANQTAVLHVVALDEHSVWR